MRNTKIKFCPTRFIYSIEWMSVDSSASKALITEVVIFTNFTFITGSSDWKLVATITTIKENGIFSDSF